MVQVVVFAPEDFHLDSDVVAALVVVLPLPLGSVVVVNVMEGDGLAVARLTGLGQEPGHAVRKIILNTNIRKAYQKSLLLKIVVESALHSSSITRVSVDRLI